MGTADWICVSGDPFTLGASVIRNTGSPGGASQSQRGPGSHFTETEPPCRRHAARLHQTMTRAHRTFTRLGLVAIGTGLILVGLVGHI